MTPVEVAVRVDADPDVTFDYIADFEHNPEWQSGIASATWTSDGPPGVGSTYRQTAAFLGRTIETEFEVTAYEPGRLVRIESVSSTFPIRVTRRVEPVDGGALVSAVIEGEPAGLFALLGPLLRWLTRRRIEADYARLVERLAGDERPPAGAVE